MNTMKRILLRYRAWRDERFRRRIDRVYFRTDSAGRRYIDGDLVARDVFIFPDKSVKFPLDGAYSSLREVDTTTPDNNAGSGDAIISGCGKVSLDSNCNVFAFFPQGYTDSR